jgi:hypothetical protein
LQWIEDHGKHTPERAYDRPASAQQSSVVLCSPTGSPAVKTRSINLEEFDFEKIGESLTDKDKIVFIVNNLSAKNLREKVLRFVSLNDYHHAYSETHSNRNIFHAWHIVRPRTDDFRCTRLSTHIIVVIDCCARISVRRNQEHFKGRIHSVVLRVLDRATCSI